MNIRKRILKGLLKVSIFSCVLFLRTPVDAGQLVRYRTYHPGTGEEFNRFYGSIEKNRSGGYQVRWMIEESGTVTQEDYLLGESFETLRFRVVNAGEGTDYVGERRAGEIFILGQFKGQRIDRILTIDERPFHYNPKIGLTGFVRSGAKEDRFWGFQNKELKAYPMKAVHQGTKKISIGGERIKAAKVYWTVDDLRSAFFKRTYWFRGDDGLYLKQKSDGGKMKELVSEEGEL